MGERYPWDALDRLVTRADAEGLLAHRLGPFGARSLRARGREVPPELAHEERLAALGALSARPLLEEICRHAGPVMLVKGPEVAARYPDPALRPLRDVDLVAADADAAQAALLAAGFEPYEEIDDNPALHHRRPLLRPGLPLLVEVHDRLKWLPGARAPRAEELLALAVPSALAIDGLLTLPAAEHAVYVAVHAWAHQPLRRVLDLVDVAVLADGCDPAELDAAAERWGVERVWRTTRRATDAVLGDRPATLPLRTWARNVRDVRERTVLEGHLERWTAAFWSTPPRPAIRAAARAVGRNLRPEPGQTWRAKLRRTLLTLRHSFRSRSEHDYAAAAERSVASRSKSRPVRRR